MNTFLGTTMISLLAADPGSTYDTITEQVLDLVNTYIIPGLMTAVTIVLVIVGIVTGVQLAKAASEEEKTKAKKRLLGLGLGIVVCVASIWLIPLLIDLLAGIFTNGGINRYQ